MSFLYKSEPTRGARWADIFATRAPEINFHIWPSVNTPEQVRYLAACQLPDNIAETFPNLELVFSVDAGIYQLDLWLIPEHITVVRRVEPGLNWLTYTAQMSDTRWPLRTADTRRVGVLGLGVLRKAVLKKLASFGFQCAGWSRSEHNLLGTECFSGTQGLSDLLARSDILICLLPLTDATRGLLSRKLFRQLPQKVTLINRGRAAAWWKSTC